MIENFQIAFGITLVFMLSLIAMGIAGMITLGGARVFVWVAEALSLL